MNSEDTFHVITNKSSNKSNNPEEKKPHHINNQFTSPSHLGAEFLTTFIGVTEDRIYKQFEHDQSKIDFTPRPSIFLPITFNIKTYMKIPIDETGKNGITKEQAKEIVEKFIIKEEEKIPIPPSPPSPKGSEMKPTSMCLHQ